MSQASSASTDVTVTRRNKRARGVESSITDPPAALTRMLPKATEWCFTFNNYTVEDIDNLVGLFRSLGAIYLFQRERGESGTPHLQGVVRFAKSLTPIQEFAKVYPRFSAIHWEICRSWDHSVRYCSKTESREEGTEPYGNTRAISVPVIYGWQSHLVDVLLPSFSPRSVHWFHEPVGGVGKSLLVRYLCMTRNAILVAGKDSDIKCGVSTYTERMGAGPELVIVDVPRCSAGYVSYSGIEQVANGCFFSSKYESMQVIIEPPIMLVFANVPPDMSKMSYDRWRIFRINIDLAKCVPE